MTHRIVLEGVAPLSGGALRMRCAVCRHRIHQHQLGDWWHHPNYRTCKRCELAPMREPFVYGGFGAA